MALGRRILENGDEELDESHERCVTAAPDQVNYALFTVMLNARNGRCNANASCNAHDVVEIESRSERTCERPFDPDGSM